VITSFNVVSIVGEPAFFQPFLCELSPLLTAAGSLQDPFNNEFFPVGFIETLGRASHRQANRRVRTASFRQGGCPLSVFGRENRAWSSSSECIFPQARSRSHDGWCVRRRGPLCRSQVTDRGRGRLRWRKRGGCVRGGRRVFAWDACRISSPRVRGDGFPRRTSSACRDRLPS